MNPLAAYAMLPMSFLNLYRQRGRGRDTFSMALAMASLLLVNQWSLGLLVLAVLKLRLDATALFHRGPLSLGPFTEAINLYLVCCHLWWGSPGAYHLGHPNRRRSPLILVRAVSDPAPGRRSGFRGLLLVVMARVLITTLPLNRSRSSQEVGRRDAALPVG
jgi:hypothetical protein